MNRQFMSAKMAKNCYWIQVHFSVFLCTHSQRSIYFYKMREAELGASLASRKVYWAW